MLASVIGKRFRKDGSMKMGLFVSMKKDVNLKRVASLSVASGMECRYPLGIAHI